MEAWSCSGSTLARIHGMKRGPSYGCDLMHWLSMVRSRDTAIVGTRSLIDVLPTFNWCVILGAMRWTSFGRARTPCTCLVWPPGK